MKRIKIGEKIGLMVACICTLFLAAQLVWADEETEKIKVAYPIQYGLAEYDEKTGYYGYTYEYLKEIEQYTGLEFEFERMEATNENLVSMLDQLKSGEIDLVGSMNYSEELANTYDYVQPNYGYSYGVLCAAGDNKELNELNFYHKKELKIGIRKLSPARKEALEAALQENGATYQYVLCDTEEELLNKLKNQEVDIIYVNSLRDYLEKVQLKILVKLDPRPFYFATTKGNTELVQKIEMALKEIEKSKRFRMEEKEKKYFSSVVDGAIFTEKEEEYLKEHQEITVLLPINSSALADMDTSTGKYKGICVEIMEHIAKETGLKVNYIMPRSAQDLENKLKAKQADILMGMPYSYAAAEKDGVVMTQPYLTSTCSLVSKGTIDTENMMQKTIAVREEGLAPNAWASDKIHYYDSEEACVQAVLDKEVDYAYGNFYLLQYSILHMGRQDLLITPVTDASQELCIGVLKPADTPLISILNRSIGNISDAEKNVLAFEYTLNVQGKITVAAFVRDNLILCVVGAIIFTLLLLALLIWYIRTKTLLAQQAIHEKDLFKIQAQQDGLTGIYNASTSKAMVREVVNQKTVSTGVLLILDVDYFKNINDLYGHLIGDQILSNLGELLQRTFRADDILGRVGGDEFMVFMRDISKKNAIEEKCQEVLREFSAYGNSIHLNEIITLSIGGCMLEKNVNFNMIYQRADIALYQAKKEGRNQFVLYHEGAAE